MKQRKQGKAGAPFFWLLFFGEAKKSDVKNGNNLAAKQYYELLGLYKSADKKEVKRAYKKLFTQN